MNFKKIFSLSLAAMLCVTSLVVVNANTSSNGTNGGWDEETGYFVNAPLQSPASLSLSSVRSISNASSRPQSHVGRKDTKIGLDESTSIQAVGDTVWIGVLHYTRARIEDGKGNARKDSGRVWGTDGTHAESG